MRITGQGSVYQVEAYPWNEKAFNTSNNMLLEDYTIEGGDVQQMLQTGTVKHKQSLQKVINDALMDKAEDKGAADKILIFSL